MEEETAGTDDGAVDNNGGDNNENQDGDAEKSEGLGNAESTPGTGGNL